MKDFEDCMTTNKFSDANLSIEAHKNNHGFPIDFNLKFSCSGMDLNLHFIRSEVLMNTFSETNVYIQDSIKILRKKFDDPLVSIYY